MPRLVSVEPLPDFRLRLAYTDGAAGVVDVSELAGRGVFRLWNDPAAFARVVIGSAGELRWSDEVDLCGDALYLQLTGRQPEDLFLEPARQPAHA